MKQNTKSPFFVASVAMVPFLLLYTFALAFLVPNVGGVPSFTIGIMCAMLILLLACMSRFRQEPPRGRSLAMVVLMILYMSIMAVGLFLWQ